MNIDEVKQALLDYGWDAAERRRITQVIRTLETSDECQRAAADYDRIRAALAPPSPDEEPGDAWTASEQRLVAGLQGRRSHRWWIAAAAATILLAVGIHRLFPWTPSPGGPVGAPALAGLQFTPPQIRDNVSAFQEIANVFDGRASWVLLAERTSDLGLAAEPAGQPERILLFRLVLLQSEAVISNADLMIVPGQAAEVSVPCRGGRRLRYHVCTSTDRPTRLTLWVELEGGTASGQTLAALATDLRVEPGSVFAAGQMATSSGDYDLRVSFAEARQ